MKFLTLLCFLAVAALSPAGAATITYSATVSSTLNGGPITNLLIFETDGANVQVDYSFDLPSSGLLTLTHEVAFTPTLTMIMGLNPPDGTGDDKTHVVMFIDRGFSASTQGMLFSQIYPNSRHSDIAARILAASQGDAAEIAYLTGFFLTGDGAPAAFASSGDFSVVEYSIPTEITIPEPGSMTLLTFGFGLLTVAMRRRKR